MKRILLLLALLGASVVNALAWDGLGHSTIAMIAERHLTPRAKANIERYTEGRSITFYSSWMDANRKSPGYEMTDHWHVDYWTDNDRTDANGNPAPPLALSNIERIVREMPNFRELDDSTVLINIKLLVHMVGDMHCPVHVDFPKYRPWVVNLNGKNIKYHKMWDGSVLALRHVGMSPIMLAKELDKATDAEIASLVKGSVSDWYGEATLGAEKAAALLPKEKTDKGYPKVTIENYIYPASLIAEELVVKAGYRLAYILNLIFDK